MTLQHSDDAPPVLTAPAMTRRWRDLLGNDGFGRRELWVALFDDDGHQLPAVPVIDDLPERADPAHCRALVGQLGQVLRLETGAGGCLAMALARAGGWPAQPADEAWAAALLAAAEAEGVALLSVHLAVGAHVRLLR